MANQTRAGDGEPKAEHDTSPLQCPSLVLVKDRLHSGTQRSWDQRLPHHPDDAPDDAQRKKALLLLTDPIQKVPRRRQVGLAGVGEGDVVKHCLPTLGDGGVPGPLSSWRVATLVR